MSRLTAPHFAELVPYTPGKPIEELERELGIEGAVKLASNESPVGPSPRVIEEMRRVAGEMHRYPDAGCFALRRDLSAFYGIPMDEIVLGHGSNELIDLLYRTFVTPSEHVVFGDPSFVCYWLGAVSMNVPFTKVPLRDHLHWDVDALLDAVRPETKLLFVTNPNNPTGSYVPKDAMRKLLRVLPEGCIVVVDEAYAEFADADDFESAIAMRSLRERLVVLRTFSKAYGLAGLRVGYGFATREMCDYINRVRAPFNVGTLAQVAARAALSDRDWVDRYVALNQKERARLTGTLRERGYEVVPSQANFVLARFPVAGRELYDRLLRMGVIVRAMAPPVADWVRITVGLPEENDRLVRAVAEVCSR